MIEREPVWVRAFPEEELCEGKGKLFKHGGKQVAVFKLEDGRCFAVDNLCPHEGYPLVQGHVRDCVLTCAWHNYKFDLRDGSCIVGDEAVTCFPLRIMDGHVELDLSEPDPSLEIQKTYKSLEAGIYQRRPGQMARDLARLIRLGVTPKEIALEAARYDAVHAEYGTTHVLPLAVDVLEIVKRRTGHDAVLPWLSVYELLSESSVRLAPREVPEAIDPGLIDPGQGVERCGERLLSLIEEEETEAAQALLIAAIGSGVALTEIESWLLRACCEHFLSFGHPLIFLTKAFDLLKEVGGEDAATLLSANLLGIILGTREDTLPTWSFCKKKVKELEPRFAELFEKQGQAVDWRREELLAAILGGKRDDVYAALLAALETGVLVSSILNVLSIAAAERLLRFNPEIERDPGLQHGWLDITHRLTFVRAVRELSRRLQHPAVLKCLFFACEFVHRAKALDIDEDKRGTINPVPVLSSIEKQVDAIVTAIRNRHDESALMLTDGFLRQNDEIGVLESALEDLALGDHMVRPIFIAHAVKTVRVAFLEHRELAGDPLQSHPVLGCVRFLASEVMERRFTQLSHEAVNFVLHGKVPITLA